MYLCIGNTSDSGDGNRWRVIAVQEVVQAVVMTIVYLMNSE